MVSSVSLRSEIILIVAVLPTAPHPIGLKAEGLFDPGARREGGGGAAGPRRPREPGAADQAGHRKLHDSVAANRAGDSPSQHQVGRAVYAAHAASADHLAELVAARQRPGHQALAGASASRSRSSSVRTPIACSASLASSSPSAPSTSRARRPVAFIIA